MLDKITNAELTGFKLPVRYIAAPFDYMDEFAIDTSNIEALLNIERIFLATTDLTMRKQMGSGSEILYFNEQLEKLVEACWLALQTDPEMATGAIPLEQPTETFLLSPFLYCTENEESPWSMRPRHLQVTTYCRPMLTIRIFFTQRSVAEWKEILNRLLYEVLSKSVNEDFADDHNPFELQLQLAALVESGYLLYVRRQKYYRQTINAHLQQQNADAHEEKRNDNEEKR